MLKSIPGNNGKNDSDFTNCLLAGSNVKYGVGRAKEEHAPSEKFNNTNVYEKKMKLAHKKASMPEFG